MAFVGGGAGGGPPNGGGAGGGAPGPSSLLSDFGGISIQQIQEALLNQQRREQQEQRERELVQLLLQQQQQQQQQQQPAQNAANQQNLLEQLQRQMAIQLQAALQAPAAPTPAPAPPPPPPPPPPAPVPQQQANSGTIAHLQGLIAGMQQTVQQITEQQRALQLLAATAGGGPVIATISTALQQQLAQTQSDMQQLQQRVLVEQLMAAAGSAGTAQNAPTNSLDSLVLALAQAAAANGSSSSAVPAQQPSQQSQLSAALAAGIHAPQPQSHSAASSSSLLSQLQQHHAGHQAQQVPLDSHHARVAGGPISTLARGIEVAKAPPPGHPAPVTGSHPPIIRGNSGLDIARANQAAIAAARAANAPPAGNLTDPHVATDHISRLISENEALLEPPPPIIKKRPYHHTGSQHGRLGQQPSIDNDSNASGSSRASPGPSHRQSSSNSLTLHSNSATPSNRPSTTRSQSLFEFNIKPYTAGGGSLTSGQPVHSNVTRTDAALTQMLLLGVDPNHRTDSFFNCSFCDLEFPTDTTRKAHEMRCCKRNSDDLPTAGPGPGPHATSAQVPTNGGGMAPFREKRSGSSGSSCSGGSDMKPPPKRKIGMEGTDHVPTKAPKVEEDEVSVARRATIGTIPYDKASLARPTVHANGATSQQLELVKRMIEQQQGNNTAPSEDVSMLNPLPSSAPPPGSNAASAVAHAKQSALDTLALLTSAKQMSHENLLPQRENVEHAFNIPHALSGDCNKPFYLTYPMTTAHKRYALANTINIQPPISHWIDATVPAYFLSKNSNIMKDISTTTSLCIRTQPSFALQQTAADSMYQVYKPPDHDDSERTLNHLFMGAVTARPRAGEKLFWRYSTAVAEFSAHNKVTHSSYFLEHVKQRQAIGRNPALANMLASRGESSTVMTGVNARLREMAVPPPGTSQAPNINQISDVMHDDDIRALVEDKRRAMAESLKDHEEEAPPPKRLNSLPPEEPRVPEVSAVPAPDSTPRLALPKEESAKSSHPARVSVRKDTIGDYSSLAPADELSHMAKQQAKREAVIGGFRTDEVYVYVRGRGRGRYICDRCGIRCKKPSMLKKHIKSHTDVRPYQCTECQFCFKTKGNLTKHLASKAHRRNSISGFPVTLGDGGRMEIDEDSDDESKHGDDEDAAREVDIVMDGGSDDEDEDLPNAFIPEDAFQMHPYHKFGQEQILLERRAHTPPSRWMRMEEDGELHWPESVILSSRGAFRRCTSAPPVAVAGPSTSPASSRNKDRGSSKSDARPDESRGESRAAGGGGGGGAGPVPPGTAPGEASTGLLDRYRAPAAGALDDRDPEKSIYAKMTPSEFFLGHNPDAMLHGLEPTTRPVPSVVLGPSGTLPTSLAGPIPAPLLEAAGLAGPSSVVSSDIKVSSAPAAAPEVYVIEKEDIKCDECSRVFRKRSEYQMHVQCHNLEKTKSRLFFCPECKSGHKTRIQLQKHMEVAHPEAPRSNIAALSSSVVPPVDIAAEKIAATAMELGEGTTMGSVILGSNHPNNPRSFMCSDCNIGFRKHGILAKHLRSKTHVMKLETAKMLPEDSLTLITKKDNGACLNEVDTSSCDTARRSILRIVDKIRLELPPGALQQAVAEQVAVARSSLPSGLSTPQNVANRPAGNPFTSAALSSLVGFQAAGLHLGNMGIGEGGSQANFNDAAAALLLQKEQLRKALESGTVWTPPRVEEAPQQPVPIPAPASNGDRAVSNGHQHSATPPALGAVAKCGVCDSSFDNAIDHQVHLLIGHSVRMDGPHFVCPRAHCEKVYPTQDSLRMHVFNHFVQQAEDGPTATPAPISKTDSPASGSEDDAMEIDVDDDDSSIDGGGLRIVEDDETPPATAAIGGPKPLVCTLCSASLSDAASFQAHLLAHVTPRPHICRICDAGFTTAEQLQFHSNNSHPTA